MYCRCKAWMSIALYAGWLSIFISNFLVLMRLWTLLPRNHRLIPWTLVFLFATQLISFGTTTWALVLMLRVMFWDSKLELCSLYSKPQVVELWVVGLAFEVLVFLVVCWNALSRPRSLQSPEEDPAMRRLLFRDGFLYFSILFVLRIANTIISSVAPISLLFVAVFFIWAGTSVTTSRLIINARRAAGSNARQRTDELQRLPTRESAVVTLYKDSG
ncbi:unnamed protein product [Mycena citricolor]|uniref:Uncharacterized protein n=1 Tax=Mycena citricolor TaxID=2018698 RepID=A0AAD2Q6Q8_9AGAR|nr:unnamed protein product [Mycena citricolor]